MKLVYLLVFVLGFITLQAQDDTAHVRKRIGKIISSNLLSERIKDSTAIYVVSIHIDVDLNKKLAPVKYEFNNSEFKRFFGDLSDLENIDYSTFLQKKKIGKFVYSAYVFVTDSTYKPAMVDIEEVYEAAVKLFDGSDENRLNLGSLIFKIDKKVYH